ncbi:MAG: response regulator [Pseudomonadota bacterium]
MAEIFFLDDSSDEALLTSILLREANDNIEPSFYLTFEELQSELDQRFAREVSFPELIAIDLNMPRRDGIDIVKWFKGDARFDGIAVGVCTGSSDPYDRQRSFAAGADFFVVKPFDHKKLEDARSQADDKRHMSGAHHS